MELESGVRFCFKQQSLVLKLKSRAHMSDEWPSISGSTWPSILLCQRCCGWDKCSTTHTEVLGPSHLHRAVVCVSEKETMSKESPRVYKMAWNVSIALWLFTFCYQGFSLVPLCLQTTWAKTGLDCYRQDNKLPPFVFHSHMLRDSAGFWRCRYMGSAHIGRNCTSLRRTLTRIALPRKLPHPRALENTNRGHPMAWSRLSASPLMEQPHRSMAVKYPLDARFETMIGASTPYSFGSLLHGRLLSLMLHVKKLHAHSKCQSAGRRPILCWICSGSRRATRCSATAWAATFFLVRTISWRAGSKTSKPASRTAAERVLPAPDTPLIAVPARPSHKARTTALRVASIWPSASCRWSKASFSAACASFSMLADSIPMATAEGVPLQCAIWYLAWGLADGEHQCTGFHTQVSIFPWACARRPLALGHSWYPQCDRCSGRTLCDRPQSHPVPNLPPPHTRWLNTNVITGLRHVWNVYTQTIHCVSTWSTNVSMCKL